MQDRELVTHEIVVQHRKVLHVCPAIKRLVFGAQHARQALQRRADHDYLDALLACIQLGAQRRLQLLMRQLGKHLGFIEQHQVALGFAGIKTVKRFIERAGAMFAVFHINTGADTAQRRRQTRRELEHLQQALVVQFAGNRMHQCLARVAARLPEIGVNRDHAMFAHQRHQVLLQEFGFAHAPLAVQRQCADQANVEQGLLILQRQPGARVVPAFCYTCHFISVDCDCPPLCTAGLPTTSPYFNSNE